MHSGPSASSGHYVTLIKNFATGDTYKFNDTNVERIADKKFNVASEEEQGQFGSVLSRWCTIRI